jgi:hypothetical protein
MNYESLPKNVYYDANIINNDQKGTEPPKLVFQDIRSTPILTYPHLYELSVVRFQIQTANSLPLWIPSIQFDQINFDPNLTIYSFTLEYFFDGETYSSGQTYVQYIPSDKSQPIPTSNETHIPYYYVKSFNAIVEMFNNALNTAFQRLANSAGYFGVNLPTQNRPFFEWDSDSSKFILNGDVEGFDSNNTDNHISIYCNTGLYTLISGFQSDYYGTKALEGKNYYLKLSKDIRELNLFKINDTYSVIQLQQEYSSASLFTPISSIVFTTNLIPVLPSNSTKPTIFNGSGDLTNSGNNNNLTNMITDFESQDNNGYGFSGSLSYIPTAEYRFISLNNGNEKINNIDISVYWKDAYSHLHPLYLYPGMKCDIKILFRKLDK